VAENVGEHGTGALNIDASRVPAPDAPEEKVFAANAKSRHVGILNGGKPSEPEARSVSASREGRWPANLLLTYPEDQYMLRDDVTPDQLHKLAEWMNENAKR
jgi:hypothetical protein